MDNRVALQPAYVLHRRPFQNSSLLIDFFTLDYGLVRGIAKGARGNKSRYRSLLQLFSPVLVSLSGRSEIKTVTGVESQLNPITLQGLHLFSGLYMNELLVRLLHNHEEHASLYRIYQSSLLAMQSQEPVEQVLRRFEMSLLADLGYGINLESDCVSHEPITAQREYYFAPEVGFSVDAVHGDEPDSALVFSGAHVLALRDLQFNDAAAAQSAKRILRMALARHLGNKPLASRALFSRRSGAG